MTTDNGSRSGSTGAADGVASGIAKGADDAGSDGRGRVRDRRGFLVGAGAAAGVAGAAAVALKSRGQPAADDVIQQPAVEVAGQGRGYHETAHIRKYYDTTKV